jgi:predicted ATP-grasp superfamily ATP-dependent carboligase
LLKAFSLALLPDIGTSRVDDVNPKMARNAPVVILNMHYTGLAIARALQACGAGPIYGLGAHERMFGNFSRHCTYIRSPDTLLAPEQCRDFLLTFTEQFDSRPLLFPTRDHDLQFISRYYRELMERYAVVSAPPEMLEKILNKASLYEVAEGVGLPYPATAWINSRSDIERAQSELSFPVIAKPVYSTQWRRSEMWELVGRQKAVVIHDADALARFYAPIESVDPLIHVQEFIPGADADLVVFGSYVSPVSGALRYFTGRKLLQYPPQSGTGVAVQACRVPEIVDMSQRLLAQLGYQGVSELEYKHDRRTGKYVLIEMNPRFWDQHGVGASVGVNLAECVYLDMTHGYVPDQHQSAEPFTWIAEDGYLMSFLLNLKTRACPVREFAAALKGRTRLAVFEPRDWRPGAVVATEFVQDVARMLWRRSSARRAA